MSDAFPITIYHNPDCGTSRNALGMILAAGYAPDIVEYRKVGWSPAQLRDLLAALGLSARDVLRDKGTPAAELGLLDGGMSEDAILDAMVAHPILVNRPIVITPEGARLCRPSELVLDLLDTRPASYAKEDGEIVPADGRRDPDAESPK